MAGPFQVSNPYHSQGLGSGGSALLDAVNKGKIHLAKFILDAGENDIANTRDFKGKTPLIRSCYIKEEKTRAAMVNALMTRNVNVNAQDDAGRTALSYACEMRCNDIVKILVKNNIDPNIPDNKENTALIYSAMVGNDTAVEILVKSFRRLGFNVDHLNQDGLTALLIAAKNGFMECASILALEGRANIAFRDKVKGYNAEEWARANGCSNKQVLVLSPNVALLQSKMGTTLDCNLSPGSVRHFQGRRSFHAQGRFGDQDLLADDFAQMGIGGDGMDKILQKRGSLPSSSLSMASRTTNVSKKTSNCRTRSSSSLGFGSSCYAKSPDSLLSCHSSSSSLFYNRPERMCDRGTQTDNIQGLWFNTEPERPKSADPCTRFSYDHSVSTRDTCGCPLAHRERLCMICHSSICQGDSPFIDDADFVSTNTGSTKLTPEYLDGN